jgi:hypothetical protein
MFTVLIVITCLAILYFIFPRATTALAGVLGVTALGFMFYTVLPTTTLLMMVGFVGAVSVLAYVLVRKGYIESGLD